MKKVFLSGMNDLQRVARMRKMIKEVVVQDLTGPMKMLKKYGILCILIDVCKSYGCGTNLDKETRA
jgi:hypothetical protein